MKLAMNMIRQYADIPVTPEEYTQRMIMTGTAVEGAEDISGGMEKVVVGRVLTCTDVEGTHLHECTVDVGGPETLHIVCGAPNVAAGQLVVVAPVGSTLPGGLVMKKAKLRGVPSFGMICSERELGLADDHSGILVLPEENRSGRKVMPGEKFVDAYELDKEVLDISITPNRADCLSVYGFARLVGAYLHLPVTLPSFHLEEKGEDMSGAVPVEVKDGGLCPSYMGRILKGAKVKPSPAWMRYRLHGVGVRAISNLVDVTNYILMELGQPLHAFDAAKIEGREVVVRTCAEGTPFVTLDGVERKLTDKDLMICSAERPMCIAGVFGGLDSGVSDTTTDVFIESAYFNPVWVRKTAKRFGLNTDSSFRFERGIDPNMQVYAAKRAALLMKELAGGTISSGITDIYPEPIGDFVFDISLARVNALIGKEIPETVVRTIIAALEVKILAEKDGVLTVAVPPYRVDVQREADLVEDILRIYGYNNVEIPTQVRSTLSYAPKPDRNRLMNLAADFLTANGFTEIMSNSLTKAAYYEGLTSCPAERCVRILNPLSADLNVMRQTLLFNMLEAVGLNANRRNGDLCLYEFGNCYFYDESKRTDENRLAAYSEEYRLAIAVTGVSTPQSWNAKPVKASFFTLRAVAEKLLRRFGVDIYALKAETLESDLFSEGLTLSLNGKQLLQIGSVAAAIRRRTDVKQDVYYLEMNFEALAKSTKKLKIAAGELSKFPEVRRDLALLVDKSVTFSSLRDAAFAAERKLLKSVSLFDVYEGDKLPEGKKSYALSFILEDKTRTLDERTIERVMANLTRQFEQKCGAQVRA